MIAIVAGNNQVMLQADFPSAYVNAAIDEDVYVCQPRGMESKDKNEYLCKLKKALYGCPISGKRRNETITRVILSLGYHRSVIDQCLFLRGKNGSQDLLVLYVDDILVTSSKGEHR